MAPNSLTQAIPNILLQPSTIAWVSSLALHGIVGVNLPAITGKEPQAETQRTVKLIELTPAEQSRLPIPVTPTQQPGSLSSQIPYFPPGSSNPIPGSPDAIPGYTPPSNIPFTPPSVTPWNWSYPPQRNTPPIRQTPPRTNPPPDKLAGMEKGEVKKFPGEDANRDFKVAETVRFGRVGNEEDPETQETPPISRTRPERISQTAIEQLRQLQQQKRAARRGGNANTSNPPNSEGDSLGNTTQQAQATANLGTWISKHNIQLTGLETIGLAPTENPQNLKGNAIVAVWVDAEGKVNYPELIQPSNNETLDKTALEIASRYSFPKESFGKVFMVVVKFGDDANPANTNQQKEG
ncbi:MAG: energy transducer TonB [Leptolyngbyaceae cyanobacterium bins.59]|nr:energy transducer TonB [Leptolyngbyaceae cyanobacterium bins.59]